MSGAPDFALRPLQGAPPRATRVDYVILDGQQRLTSLFHAFVGAGDDVWILNARQLPDNLVECGVDDVEDAISSIARSKWDTEYPLRRQATDLVVPLHSLESPADFFEWRDHVVDEAPSRDRKEIRSKLTNLYKGLLSRAHEYSFPAVVLQAELPVEAIARIFERINRTGLRLTTFDLMVARTYHPDWNLREEWRKSTEAFPILGDFVDDGLLAMQIVSLRSAAADIRQPAVLQTDPSLVRQEFDAACRSLAGAFHWLVSECGVRDPAWVPYGVMPVVVGALVRDGGVVADVRLRRWYWLSVLTQRYDVASSTQAASDYNALSSGRELSFPSVRNGSIQVAVGPLLEGTRRRAAAFWRGFACALGVGELVDVMSSSTLIDHETGLLLNRTALASVFPRGDAPAGRSPYHLRVLSNFVANVDTARALSGKPNAWHRAQFESEALVSQLLPSEAELPELVVAPDAFLEARLRLFLHFVEAQSDVSVDLV